MKIAIVSKSNSSSGGASHIASLHAEWLAAKGYDVTHWVSHKSALTGSQTQLYGPAVTKFCTTAFKLMQRYRLGPSIPVDLLIQCLPDFSKFDIVHFHDHYLAFSPQFMQACASKTKTFFTAHDCLHFTGSQLYETASSRRYWPFEAWARHVCQKVAQESALTYIYPSKWLLDLAETKLKFKKQPQHIPNGIDQRTYQPPSRAKARALLNIPDNRLVVCIAAQSLMDERKGAKYAIAALQANKVYNPFVLLIGHQPSPQQQLALKLNEFDFKCTGYISERKELGVAYAAADLTMICSLQDNLPIIAQESMLAGTPLVGFATGGIPEITNNNETAWLAPTRDQTALNDALATAIKNPQNKGELAKQYILKHFSREQHVASLIQLYQKA